MISIISYLLIVMYISFATLEQNYLNPLHQISLETLILTWHVGSIRDCNYLGLIVQVWKKEGYFALWQIVSGSDLRLREGGCAAFLLPFNRTINTQPNQSSIFECSADRSCTITSARERWPMQIGHWVSSQWQPAVNLIWFKCNRRAPRWTIEEDSQIQKTLLAKKNIFLSRIRRTALTLPLILGTDIAGGL